MPSVSRSAAVTSWAFAPMPFSARGGAVEMIGQIPLSDIILTTTAPLPPQSLPIFHYKSTEGLPPPLRRPTPPIQKKRGRTLVGTLQL